ncbi:copper amine oxidase N-terminal domain-containing protein [Fusibacter sp. 3D3]|uniref:copper amine oxidase N-terminal domain-containing protein n=1 Tax=Fusibacter sp. 3D3 TaxID=1048380 RepID=UPI000852A1EA|nr:copper amine oxidase N-terminal domain-containing protein [Fusibacter sp. 3D3]GAU77692.1 streptococcal hemagglutinin protein [Fusibacter sp. 3D3]
MKKSVVIGLVVLMVFSSSVVSAYTGMSTKTYAVEKTLSTSSSSEAISVGIDIVVDGVTLDLSEAGAEIREGRVYVPLKFICDALDLDVTWDGETETVTVGKAFSHIVGKSYVTLIDGTTKDVQSNSFIKDGRTMVSVRLFAEAIGAEVAWDSSTRTVTIDTDDTTSTSTKTATIPTGEPPTGEKPTGEPPTGEKPTGEPPTGEPPTGEKPSGTPPNAQATTTTSVSSLITSVYELATGSKTLSSQTYSATDEDESAVWVNSGATLTLSDSTLTKTGDSSNEETSNFYGLNSAVLVMDGSALTLSDSKITTNAKGANAVVSTGTNSKATVSNLNISTTENSSRGLHATNGGTIIASNVTIKTLGDHCAAIATDRGSGTVTVTTGTFNTAGDGSPGLYSTGKIKGTDITSVATGSEAAVIEGRNSLELINSNITGTKKWGVMIYQSFSGDAEVGKGVFTMTNGSITSKEGPMFYSTNTQGEINLTNVTLNNTTSKLMTLGAGDWGTAGSNGSSMIFNASNQILKGAITVDSISSLTLNLTDDSVFAGSIDVSNTAKYIELNLDLDSSISLTATSYVDVLTDKDTTLSNIISNGYTLYYNASEDDNAWLKSKTISLSGGGYLKPLN